ncbi:hypothetical protein [Chryseobacterium gambrini]
MKTLIKFLLHSLFFGEVSAVKTYQYLLMTGILAPIVMKILF